MKVYGTPHRRLVLLGPVPCAVCRRAVEWDGLGWLYRGTEIVHNPLTCPGPPRKRR